MAWPDAGSETIITGQGEGAKSVYISQDPKELHRIYVKRTDSPLTQVGFVRVWGSPDGLKETEEWSEEHPIGIGIDSIEFPLVGYRFFALEIATGIGADDAVVDFTIVGDGGL